MNQSASTQTTTKPLGLILVAVYTGISAVLNALWAVVLLFTVASPEATPPWWDSILGFAVPSVVVLAIAATYGLWALVSWGNLLARLFHIISIPLALISLRDEWTTENVTLQLVTVALAIWILVYLAKPKIKGLFRAS